MHLNITISELGTALATALTAFAATNIDDIIILLLFFSQTNKNFRWWHIVIGQYLGFTAIIIFSLPGVFWWFGSPKRMDWITGTSTYCDWFETIYSSGTGNDRTSNSYQHSSLLFTSSSSKVFSI